MERFLISEASKHVGEKVTIAGWVNVRRAHGKILFLDIRDRSGLMQVVFTPGAKECYDLAQEVRPEWVVKLTGQIVKRPDHMVNPNIVSGQVEMSAETIEVLAKAETPPFPIDDKGYEIDEEIRLKYRYLDLRRERMANNLRMRHKMVKSIRDFLSAEDFTEIETPILTKSTPEGARDFVVPSRMHAGQFYALPQSPQQYKQIFMVAGMERYFQIARCFRDEDQRGDRQLEFTQLDVEMSFVDQEDIMELTERMLIMLVKQLYPHKKIQQIPFPRISYHEAMKKYKSDRPDLREDKNDENLLAFCWVVDFPFFEKTEEGGWTFTHNPFSAAQPKFADDLMQKNNIEKILASQYDIVLNGFEIGGGSIRNHNPEALKKVFEIMGYDEETIQKNFGHMLEAFKYGTPPHGGIAPGIDRIMMILQNEPNIREVIAFPKTGDGRDPMMNAPSEISKKQLEELHIQTGKKSAMAEMVEKAMEKVTPKKRAPKKK
jgi:aspartyl-tRNA synthetase